MSANQVNSDAKTHHTAKAPRAKSLPTGATVSRKLSECVRVLASLFVALLAEQ
jgi:hypothetical protein